MTVTGLSRDRPGDDPGLRERVPPQDLAAEQCTLGAMLLSKDAISDVVDVIRPGDLYRPAHQLVYEAILDLYAHGDPVDAITVAAELTRTGTIRQAGGALYLHTLIASVPTAASAGYYARIVAGKALLRRLAGAGAQISQDAYTDMDADIALDRAQAAVYAAGDHRGDGSMRPISEVLPATLEQIGEIAENGGKLAGVPTGFADLDALTGGLHPGQLLIIAARPGLGKTMLAVDWLRSAALRHRLTSVMFSLEMSQAEIAMRILAAEAKVPMHYLRNGQLDDGDWTKIGAVAGPAAAAPLFIDDSPGLTVSEIRAKCRRLRQKHDLRLVVIDYLQLMTSPRRAENRQQEVSEISRSLKLLAKELGVPVVAVSQLNRGPEARSDKKPYLSDLRESGSIEQDSDVVILLHREDAYDAESPRAGEADLIVAKHRNGPTATVTVACQAHYARFVDMAPASGWPSAPSPVAGT